jgi:hypothetical protein
VTGEDEREMGGSMFPSYAVSSQEVPSGLKMEILDSNELALRLKVKESWVIEQSKRSRTSDPIPVFRLGKHRRYRWGSPEMNDWLSRRVSYTTTHMAGAH